MSILLIVENDMTAKDNLSAIHKVDGLQLNNANGSVIVRSQDVGCINIASGKIVLGNPMIKGSMSDFKRKCLAHDVTPGVYPVLVYHAQTESECYVAFAEIRFSDKRPVRYVTAKTISDAETKRRGFCGYPVHESATGFMDADTFEKICNLPRYKDSLSLLELDEDQEGIENYAIAYDNERNPCAVQFRVAGGYYYWYWGKDSNGEICCLIGDFFTFA